MILLLDTQLVLWAALDAARLSRNSADPISPSTRDYCDGGYSTTVRPSLPSRAGTPSAWAIFRRYTRIRSTEFKSHKHASKGSCC